MKATQKKRSTEQNEQAELKRKIKAINVIGRLKLGLDDDLLHAVVYDQTSKLSIRELTVPEANRVISTLLNVLDNKKPARNTKGNVAWLITPHQKELILQLSNEMLWGSEQIDKFSIRQYKKPLNQLRLEQAQGLIEALKAIIQRNNNAKLS